MRDFGALSSEMLADGPRLGPSTPVVCNHPKKDLSIGARWGIIFRAPRLEVRSRTRRAGEPYLNDRQITHRTCVRLRHLLYDSFRGCFGPFNTFI